MVRLISLADVPPIPSMDSIYTGSSAPLAIAASSIRAILRRTKSMGYLNKMQDSRHLPLADEGDGGDGYARGRATSPVMTNSRRRRSAAPVVGSRTETRCSSDSGSVTKSPPLRPGSVELGWPYHQQFLSGSEAGSCTQSRTTSERSPSRGRARRRDNIPTAGHHRRDRTHQPGRQKSISRRRQSIQSTGVSSRQDDCSSSSHINGLVNDDTSYITKGIFRLQNYPEPEKYRFPKSKSAPEFTLRLGDGFSDDEVSPEVAFGLAVKHKHKRKRSRSLSTLGKLSLETEDAVKRRAVGGPSNQPYQRSSQEWWAGVHRTDANEVWPTRENFTDSSIANKPKSVETKDHTATQYIPLLNAERRSTSRPAIRNALPRMRRVSEFENFGIRKRRSQSRRGRDPSSLPASVQGQHQGQHQYQANSDWDVMETDGLYEHAGNEIGQMDMVEDESNSTPAMEYTFEVGDSSSGYASEDDSGDEDTEMMDATPD